MLEKGKKVSVYKIKEVLRETSTHVSCLTKDPFFHSTVLLKVYPLDFLENKQQRKDLNVLLEKLFLLEHPSIASVLDSGFEGEYFYYTTSHNHQASLLEHTTKGLSSEEILKIVRELGSAQEYAFEQGFGHGNLTTDDIYFDDEGQAVIADYGIEYCFKCFRENQKPVWLEQQELEDLGRLLLQLLRPSSMDNRGRELELLAGIENEQLKKLCGRFFTENADRYRSFSELLEALDTLLEQPPVETRPMVQKKSLQVCPDAGISKQQRNEVLPHVRQLIAEKNHYKTLLDEALLGQNEAACKLKQTQLEFEQFTQDQLDVPQQFATESRKKIAGVALGGVVLGIILSSSYGFVLPQKSFQQPTPVIVVEKQTVPKVPVIVEKEVALVLSEPLIEEKASTVGIEIMPLILQNKDAKKQTKVIAVQSQQWCPAGQEFLPVANTLKTQAATEVSSVDGSVLIELSEAESDIIFDGLLGWVDSWSKQNPSAYFSYYSDQYRPELGKNREEWLQTRTARLLRPEWIKVEIEDISIRLLAENRVQVKFQQSYHSNSYQDKVWKSLNLIAEDDGWQILTERSLGKINLVASK